MMESAQAHTATRPRLLVMLLALVAALACAGAISLATPQQALAEECYAGYDEVILEFGSRDMTYREYILSTGAFDTGTVDTSMLGGIVYDATTGTLTVSGSGAEKAWVQSKWYPDGHEVDLEDFSGVAIAPSSPDKQIRLTVDFEIPDYDELNVPTYKYMYIYSNASHDYCDYADAHHGARISNATGGTTVLTSQNGSKVYFHVQSMRSNPENYYAPSAVYSKGPVYVTGNLSIDVDANYYANNEENAVMYGIWSESWVDLGGWGTINISAHTTSTNDHSHVCAPIRVDSMGSDPALRIQNAYKVFLECEDDDGVILYTPNRFALAYDLVTQPDGTGRTPEIQCLYHDGSFGLTKSGVASAVEKDGYALESVEGGVMYSSSAGLIIKEAVIGMSLMPQLGQPVSCTYAPSTDGVRIESIEWYYRKGADHSWVHVASSAPDYGHYAIPLDATEARAVVIVRSKSGYYFDKDITGVLADGASGVRIDGEQTNFVNTGDYTDSNRARFEFILPVSMLRPAARIGEIEVTDVTAPVAGAHPWSTSSSNGLNWHEGEISSDANYKWARSTSSHSLGPYDMREWWTEQGSTTVLASSYSFEAGHTYIYHALLEAKDGYLFAPSGIAATVSGSSDTMVGYKTVSGLLDDSLVEVYWTVECPDTTLDKVSLSYLTMPRAGQYPNANAQEAYDGAPYWIDEQGWLYRSPNSPSYVSSSVATSKFQQLTPYYYYAYIAPEQGYKFGDGSAVQRLYIPIYIDGRQAGGSCWYLGTSDPQHVGEILVVSSQYFVPADPTDSIETIELTTEPFGRGIALEFGAESQTEGVSVRAFDFSDPDLWDLSGSALANVSAINGTTGFWLDGDAYEDLSDVCTAATGGTTIQVPEYPALTHDNDFYALVDLGDKYLSWSDRGDLRTTVTVNGIPAELWNYSGTRNPYANDHLALVQLHYKPTEGDGANWLYVPAGCKVREGRDGNNVLLEAGTDGEYVSGSVVRYAMDPEMDYQVTKGDWEAPYGEKFWKWECTTGNVNLGNAYNANRTNQFRGSTDGDVAIVIRTSNWFVPTDISTSNNDIVIEGWDNNWGAKPMSASGYYFVLYDGTAKEIRPTRIVDNNGTPSDPTDDYVLVEGEDYVMSYTPNVDAGTVTATITGVRNDYNQGFDGTRTRDFMIQPTSLGVADITFDDALMDHATTPAMPWFWWTGEEMRPAFTLTYNGMTLVEGTDYEFITTGGSTGWTDNTKVGTARVALEGLGNYQGYVSYKFEIRARDVRECEIEFAPDLTFDGTYQEPKPVLTFEGETLVEDTHYRLDYEHNRDASDSMASVTVYGKESAGWTGEKTLTFSIKQRDLSDEAITWNEQSDVWYTGDFITKSLSGYPASLGSNAYLSAGRDFTIKEQRDNLWPGTATVVLQGIGNYCGTTELSFDIYAHMSELECSGVESSYAYTGSQITPKPSQVWLESNGHGSKTLTEGTDYIVSWGDNTAVGTKGTVTITPVDTTHFQGVQTLFFDIVQADISGATIAPIPAQRYDDGNPVEPKLTVTLGGKTLVEGTDYWVEYFNNVDVGTATVIVHGDDNYTSEATATFTIANKNLADATIAPVPDQTYTGSAITPALSVTYEGTTLTAGTDYTVAYTNNVKAGTATATITGAGDYAGTKTVTFTIKPKSVSETKQNVTWKRIWGQNALDTMQKIAAEYGKASTAVVTTNADYRDALAASGLAGAKGALVLTTAKGSLSPQTAAALKKSGVKTVIVVGSTSDVSANAYNQIKKVSGVKSVSRVSGGSASAKAIAAAKKAGKKSDTVIIATQNSFKDALSIAPYAYATKSPILYAETSKKLSSATTSYIKSAKYKKAIVVGGPVALPASIDNQLKSAGVTSVTRLAGGNSYGTSELIAKWATGQLANGNYDTYKGAYITYVKFQPTTKMSADKLAVSTGQNWKDALCGAALCGKNKSVLLLGDSKTKSSDHKKAVAFCKANAAKMSKAYIFGGTSAVSSTVEKALVASTKVYTIGG